jgi:DNA modification methylase
MGARFVNPEGRNERSVWIVNTRPYDGAHFATFPPDLIEPCILAGSRKGDVVLDPFLGSGTTAAVAKKLGIELNPRYVRLAEQRIGQISQEEGVVCRKTTPSGVEALR